MRTRMENIMGYLLPYLTEYKETFRPEKHPGLMNCLFNTYITTSSPLALFLPGFYFPHSK